MTTPTTTTTTTAQTSTAAVLIADDSDTIRRLVRAMLASAGYSLLEAADGVEALAQLRAARAPLVVLLDYRMPHLDGYQVLEAAVADGHLLTWHQYVVVSADEASFPPSFVALLQRHAIRRLPKPFDQDALLAVVGQAVTRLSVSPTVSV